MTTAEQIFALKDSRYNEEYLIEERFGRRERMQTWKNNIQKAKQLYRGELDVPMPDGTSIRKQSVQNLANTAMRDLKNIVSESLPSVMCDPEGVAQDRIDRALLRQAVGVSYWLADDAERRVPKLAMDLAGAGAAFLLCYVHPDSKYPCHLRLRPEGVYPTFFQDKLVDLLYTEEIPVRVINSQFKTSFDPAKTGMVEVVDFFSPDEIWKIAYQVVRGKPSNVTTLAHVPNLIGKVPVAWAMDDSFDDTFEGILDQLGETLLVQNKIATYIVDNAARMAYAPRFSRGDIANPDDFGPNAHIRGMSPDAEMTYVQPAPVNAQVLFGMLNQLDQDSRGQVAFPAAREGEVRQSIASAAFVAATQGARSSMARNIQRHLAFLRKKQTEIDYALDEKYLDEEKPLLLPVGNKRMYTPSKVINGQYTCRVTYAGDGLDQLNQNVMRIQKVSAGMQAKETALAEDPKVLDPFAEQQKIYKDQAIDVLFRTTLAASPPEDQLLFARLLFEGKAPIEAATLLHEAVAARAQQQAQALAAQPTQPEGQLTAEQLQKGAVPGQTPPQGGEVPALPPAVAQKLQQQGVLPQAFISPR